MPNPDGSTTTLEFFIGFMVSVIASVLYAAGLNLLKKDHVANSSLSKEKQRVDCCRPLWHIGLYLYVLSQAVGSTIALSKFICCDMIWTFLFFFLKKKKESWIDLFFLHFRLFKGSMGSTTWICIIDI